MARIGRVNKGEEKTYKEVGRFQKSDATQRGNNGELKLDTWGLVTLYRQTIDLESTAYHELMEFYESPGMFMK